MAVEGTPTPAPPRPRKRLVILGVTGLVLSGAALGYSLTTARTLHLFVSNQSFDQPFANITVTVDGAIVVAREFFVDNEHNWTEFAVRSMDGRIRTAEANSGASAEAGTSRIGDRYVVVDFWFTAGDPRGARFTIIDSGTPPVFM